MDTYGIGVLMSSATSRKNSGYVGDSHVSEPEQLWESHGAAAYALACALSEDPPTSRAETPLPPVMAWLREAAQLQRRALALSDLGGRAATQAATLPNA